MKDPVPLVIVGVLNTLLPAVTPTVLVLLEVIPSQLIALEVAPPARLTDPEAKKMRASSTRPEYLRGSVCVKYLYSKCHEKELY